MAVRRCATGKTPRPGIEGIGGVTTSTQTRTSLAASIAGGLPFLRCGGASPPAATRLTKTHVAHRRMKIERVYRPYLTATETAVWCPGSCTCFLSHDGLESSQAYFMYVCWQQHITVQIVSEQEQDKTDSMVRAMKPYKCLQKTHFLCRDVHVDMALIGANL
jgi:hypothetical protein